MRRASSSPKPLWAALRPIPTQLWYPITLVKSCSQLLKRTKMAFQTTLPIRWPRAVRSKARVDSKEANQKTKALLRAKEMATNLIHQPLELLKFRANLGKERGLTVRMVR